MKPRPMSTLVIALQRLQVLGVTLQCRPSSSHSILSRLDYTQCHDRSSLQSFYRHETSHRRVRYASSSAGVAAKTSKSRVSVPAKSSTHLPRPQYNPKLNPPPETYAPPLSVPARKSGQNYFGYLWSAGRAYITFYKTGISNVRSTAKLAKQLREKAAQAHKDKGSVLTRAEWQVVRRSRRDMLRLPAFAGLVLIFGEWLPLFVIWLTPVVPETCRIPAQVQRHLLKIEKRRRERERRLAMDAARLIQLDRRPGMSQTTHDVLRSLRTLEPKQVQSLDLFNLLQMSSKLGAHSWLWDALFMRPPKTVLQWGLKRKLEYIKKDDGLIERDGGWQGLGKDELQRACVERGIDVLDKSEAELRRGLAEWFGAGRRMEM